MCLVLIWIHGSEAILRPLDRLNHFILTAIVWGSTILLLNLGEEIEA